MIHLFGTGVNWFIGRGEKDRKGHRTVCLRVIDIIEIIKWSSYLAIIYVNQGLLRGSFYLHKDKLLPYFLSKTFCILYEFTNTSESYMYPGQKKG
jgi:hypothetical protein